MKTKLSMEAKLSASQKAFIIKLQNGKTPSRSLNDRTGLSLKRMGLVNFIVLAGWVATPQGMQLNLGEIV
ncbi:hypothetical protein WFQ12_21855 [Yersinia enterocolitica]|uniref:hypothetical protein n=1 Tax=Yersinia TaxID=629 RepID=UPI001C60D3A4|nr:hypothetical protein [Yersinia kristensenii]EKN5088576.1 hypothetical protein [Yersinia enterocolitica]EKN6369439.1 hypothetical protein [Yersinia enterocolitica]ELI8387131.1 hypothetical protein [Yersinia enterocolitica]MBW5826561.1 hypothetical protein [Yersinia kristensenii]HDV7525454.1 hypothetical protein [Yersinia enterocolitica]